MPESDVAELVLRCRNGDRAAWRELVERYDRFVFSVARGAGLSNEDAADVTQVTFSALLEGLGRLRTDAHLASWLATVTRRQAWIVRARQRREPVGGNEDIGTVAAETVHDAADDVAGWERLHGLTLALGRLDPRCRDLVTALFFEPDEPSYEEISARLGIPSGSIGPMRARCLKRLRGIFEELEAQE